jgi:hypothetical protein
MIFACNIHAIWPTPANQILVEKDLKENEMSIAALLTCGEPAQIE